MHGQSRRVPCGHGQDPRILDVEKHRTSSGPRQDRVCMYCCNLLFVNPEPRSAPNTKCVAYVYLTKYPNYQDTRRRECARSSIIKT